jgi:hypothetical protein
MSKPEIVCIESHGYDSFMQEAIADHVNNDLKPSCEPCAYQYHEESLSECTNGDNGCFGECPTFDEGKAEEEFNMIFYPLENVA